MSDALLKKLYVDWGWKRGLDDARRMRIIRHMFRDKPNVTLGDKVLLQSFGTIQAVEDGSLEIGEGTLLWGKSSLSAVGPGKLRIGKRGLIGSNARIIARDSITIGDYCLMSWDVTIMDYEGHPNTATARRAQVDYMMEQFNPFFAKGEAGLSPEETRYFDTYWQKETNYLHEPIAIGDNVWIGYGASILRGVTVGDNSIIGSRSLVLKDVPPNAVVLGCPARVIMKDLDKNDRKEFWKAQESQG